MRTTTRRPPPTDRTYRWGFGIGLAVLVAVALVVLTRPVGSARPPTVARSGSGERNAMGMPVVETPGSATGAAAAGGVSVDRANWALGRVPLNVAVRPTWTLSNTTDQPVTLGEPRPEVRAGCCPGPLTLGSRTLAPGATTTLTFELSMHPGMDGWHDIGVHVPVSGGAAADHLTLAVTGDFR